MFNVLPIIVACFVLGNPQWADYETDTPSEERPGLDLAQFSQQVFPQPTFPGPCRVLLDGLPGNAVDGVPDRELVYEYDEEGNPTTADTGALRLSYSYDENGRRVVEETHRWGHGCQEQTFNFYDDTDVLVTSDIDLDCNGDVDLTETFEYNSVGDLIGSVVQEVGTGAPRSQVWFRRDEAGRVVEELVDEIASDEAEIDGSPDRRTIFDYDNEGRLVTASWDFDGDGSFDESETYFYSDSGALTHMDRDLDSEFFGYLGHRVITYEYDELGNLLAEEERDVRGNLHNRTEYDYSCFASGGY